MRVTALQAGAALAILAVIVQGFFGVAPPPAYGVCVACHGRDLVNWLAGGLLGAHLAVAPAAAAYPLLTTLGIIIGAFLAARRHGEFSWRLVDGPFKSFLLGGAAMIASLLALGCTTRLLLRLAYGDVSAVFPTAAAAAGIALGTAAMVRMAKRGRACRMRDGRGR